MFYPVNNNTPSFSPPLSSCLPARMTKRRPSVCDAMLAGTADDEGVLSMGGQCRGRGQGRSAARHPKNHTNAGLRKHDRKLTLSRQLLLLLLLFLVYPLSIIMLLLCFIPLTTTIRHFLHLCPVVYRRGRRNEDPPFAVQC